jgi:hypothetical protein
MDHNLKTMNCKIERSTKQKKQQKIHKIADRKIKLRNTIIVGIETRTFRAKIMVQSPEITDRNFAQ